MITRDSALDAAPPCPRCAAPMARKPIRRGPRAGLEMWIRGDAGSMLIAPSHAGQRVQPAARGPERRIVRNNGKPIKVDGAILAWGAVTPLGRAAAVADYGFADVLGLEDMLADLIAWQDPAWTSHVDELAGNAAGLFAALK